MKKIMILFVAVMCMAATTQIQAQEKGDMAAGVQFAYGTGDSFSNIGLGVKFQWNVIDRLRLEPSFNYFFEKDMIGMWDFSANVHYQIPLGGMVDIYPLAGLGIMGVSVDVPSFDLGGYGTVDGGSASDSEFGLNLGVGADFKLSDIWGISVEAKYKIGGEWSRLIIAAGVTYKF